jgi:hypothetical protein
MEMLLDNKGHLQISTVALFIDVRNMWEVSMEGSDTAFKFHTYMIMKHIYAGKKRKKFNNTRVYMFTILDKAKPTQKIWSST